MTDKIDGTMREGLEALLQEAISDDTMKRVKKNVDAIVDDLESDLMYRCQDQLAYHLSHWVADMAQRAVEQVLEGNEDQMRRYLSCEKRGADGEYIGWTGRSDSTQFGRKRDDHEWHQVIHGRLFEQGALALRKKMVESHRDLLVNERILDLEDQVKALVAQNNKLEAEKERLWQRVRDAA